MNDDNKGQPPASVAACPGPSGTSGPGCMQFPAPCPQDTGRYPWSTDGSGQGACSGENTVMLLPIFVGTMLQYRCQVGIHGEKIVCVFR